MKSLFDDEDKNIQRANTLTQPNKEYDLQGHKIMYEEAMDRR